MRNQLSSSFLHALIVDNYRENEKKIYIKDVFYEWIDRKLDFNEIQKASYDRYIVDFNRFFVSNPNEISGKVFSSITEGDLELPKNLFQRKVIDKETRV